MRKKLTKTDMLAAALRELFEIPHDHAKLMTAQDVISLAEWHHNEYHAHGGSDEHWNIEPMLIEAHRERTRKIDQPQIGKTRRLSKAHEEFQRLMLTPRDERPEKRSRWPSRPFNRKKP